MGITYQVDEIEKVVRINWSGQVTADILRDFYISVLSDKAAMKVRRSLTNLQDADIQFSGEAFREIIHTVLEPALEGLGWVSAIVTRDKVQWGISRQYQAFAYRYSEGSVFTDEASAIDYLHAHSGYQRPSLQMPRLILEQPPRARGADR